jgi:L-lactate dehydrogenase
VEAIVEDQQNVLPVSVRTQGAYGIHDVCLSIPSVVDLNGVQKHVTADLSSEEEDALLASAQALKESREGLTNGL